MFADITCVHHRTRAPQGDLVHVTEPDRVQTSRLPRVIDRVSKSPGGGPGARCSIVQRARRCRSRPICFGSMPRMCLALGVDTLDDLAKEIEELTTPPMPKGFMDALKLMPLRQSAHRSDAEDGEGRALSGSREDGRRAGRTADRWTWPEDGGLVHHAAAGHHARSAKPGCATSAPIGCRARPPHHRHALAAA